MQTTYTECDNERKQNAQLASDLQVEPLLHGQPIAHMGTDAGRGSLSLVMIQYSLFFILKLRRALVIGAESHSSPFFLPLEICRRNCF